MTIYHIEEMVFAGLNFLRTIHLTKTGLISMPPVIPVKSTLEELVLTDNNISVVPRGYFVGFKTLKRLIMIGNSLSLIPDISPVLNTIIDLQLSQNDINFISGEVIKTVYPLLQSLHLGGNAIKKFDSDMLTFWPSLRILELGDNRIVHLPSSYPESRMKQCSNKNASICVLHFGKNPIHCDKAVEEIITRRQDGHNYVKWNCFIEINGLHQTVCASPPYLCGQNLQKLSMCSVMSFHVSGRLWRESTGHR